MTGAAAVPSRRSQRDWNDLQRDRAMRHRAIDAAALELFRRDIAQQSTAALRLVRQIGLDLPRERPTS